MGRSWTDLVRQWLAAQNNPVKLKRFINTRLAETWEDQSRNMKPRMLAERAEDYPLKSIPPGCLILTAGIDTQNDRLAIQVTGWGRHDQCWVIDYIELPGDPNDQVAAFVKKEGALFEYLSQEFINAWGNIMTIQAVGWDTGGQRTDAIYTACRSRVVSRLLAFKGASIPGKAILAPRPSQQDVNVRGKVIRKGLGLWLIGTDTAKDVIAAHLGADADRPVEERKIHFSKGLDEDYYKMLLAEKYDPEKNRWVKPGGKRNEAIDVFVYSMAAARHPEIRIHAMGVRAWQNLERMLQNGEGSPQSGDSLLSSEDLPGKSETVPALNKQASTVVGENRRSANRANSSSGSSTGFGSSDWSKRGFGR